ncbi:hypothetical protein [Streptomyces griseosporeus]
MYAPSPAPQRCFQGEGEGGEGDEWGTPLPACPSEPERGLDGDERVVSGPGPEKVGEGAGYVGDAQAMACDDLVLAQGDPVHAGVGEALPEGEVGVGEVEGLLVRRTGVQSLDLPEVGCRDVTHDESGVEELGGSQS